MKPVNVSGTCCETNDIAWRASDKRAYQKTATLHPYQKIGQQQQLALLAYRTFKLNLVVTQSPCGVYCNLLIKNHMTVYYRSNS